MQSESSTYITIPKERYDKMIAKLSKDIDESEKVKVVVMHCKDIEVNFFTENKAIEAAQLINSVLTDKYNEMGKEKSKYFLKSIAFEVELKKFESMSIFGFIKHKLFKK